MGQAAAAVLHTRLAVLPLKSRWTITLHPHHHLLLLLLLSELLCFTTSGEGPRGNPEPATAADALA